MPDLIAPHGGLTEPSTAPAPTSARIAKKVAAQRRRPVQPLPHRRRRAVARSPARWTAPSTTACSTRRSSSATARSTPGRSRIAFPVDEATAKTLKAGETVGAVNAKSEVVGALDVSDVYPWDKPKYIASVYQTDADRPPRRAHDAQGRPRTHLVGGEVRVLPQPKHPEYGDLVLTPRETRTLFAEKGWQRVVAFQTRNPLHRAHEYALVVGLERLTREGHFAGGRAQSADRRDQGRRRRRRRRACAPTGR